MAVACGHAVTAFVAPLGVGLLWLSRQTGVGVDADGGVVACGVLVDEEVVAAVGDVVVADESTLLEEEGAAVAEVAPGACVRVTEERVAEILRAV